MLRHMAGGRCEPEPLVPHRRDLTDSRGDLCVGNCRVGVTKLDAGLLDAKHPADAGTGRVAGASPRVDFVIEGRYVRDAPIETLRRQDADFDFDHVQPTGVLGDIVKLQTAQHAAGFCGRKRLVERSRRVGREVVQHEAGALGAGVVDVDKTAQLLGEIDGCAARCDFGHAAGWCASSATKMFAVRGTDHIFSRHGLRSLATRRRPIVAREIVVCAISRTRVDASRASVQRARPVRGCEQAVAINSASFATASLRLPPGRGCSAKAAPARAPRSAASCDRPSRSHAQRRGHLRIGHAPVGGEENLGDGMSITFTATQGQYLAFIHAYVTLHRRAPAESDFLEFFRATPPTVHRMIVTLHERGLIERVPGQPRSITLLVPPDTLPPLQSIKIPATGYSVRHHPFTQAQISICTAHDQIDVRLFAVLGRLGNRRRAESDVCRAQVLRSRSAAICCGWPVVRR